MIFPEMKRKVLVIGAGPAGATAAYLLSKDINIEVTLIEKSSAIGGMAQSFELFEQIVDVGPHRFFSTDTRVNKLWLEIVEKKYKMVNRKTRIFYKNKFFDYPLKPFDALLKLGILTTIQCVISYIYARIFPHAAIHTFEGWVSNRFGKKLYSIFFKSYTEKLWGIPCSELNAEFAQQRIKKFSLGEAIISAFKLSKKKHKTLVDEFAYPIGGSGYPYTKMVEKSIQNGSIFLKNTFATQISIKQNIQVTFQNGETKTFHHLISSMPITDFLKIHIHTPQNVLKAATSLVFRNTIILYVKIKQKNIFQDQWLYIQDESIKTGRITNFNNWIPEIVQKSEGTILAMEYWCFESDEIWKMNEHDLLHIATKDLIHCGFIQKQEDITDFKKYNIPKCYPVYSHDYKPHLHIIIEYLNTLPNLQLIGRYGSFKYNNQDHSILMGILASENILKNENHNLWNINTDYEYQESSRISETGLVEE